MNPHNVWTVNDTLILEVYYVTGGVGWDSSVAIATRYGTVRGSNPGGGTRFSASVQTGPEAHPASCTMATGSFPGVKRPGRGVNHPSHIAPRLKKE